MALITTTMNFMTCLIMFSVAPSGLSLSPSGFLIKDPGAWNRRAVLSSSAVLPIFLVSPPAFSVTIANPPLPQAIKTLVLDSPGTSAGVQLYDVKIGSVNYVAVRSVQPGGLAGLNGVGEGMILLGKDSTSAADVANRIKNGRYPIVLQFYNLAAEDEGVSKSPAEALVAVQARAIQEGSVKEPPLQAKGAGLLVKTTRKAESCPIGANARARRGDTVQIRYEARVASPAGPIYDSTELRGGKPVQFILGKNEAIKGVDIGMFDMCPGEVREIDIPSLLGYGRSGSEYFDIPGDVRLWWRLELVTLTKSSHL
jgi:FK506-binding protein 2